MAKLRSTYNNVAGLNKALRRLPKEATEQLRGASREIATFVASDARGLAVHVGGIARHVAPTIQSTRDRVPVVRMGGSGRLPTSGHNYSRSRSGSRQTIGDVIWGAEYGGGARPTTRQFLPWRGSSTGAGYFLWPTIRRDSDRIHDAYSEALLTALQRI